MGESSPLAAASSEVPRNDTPAPTHTSPTKASIPPDTPTQANPSLAKLRHLDPSLDQWSDPAYRRLHNILQTFEQAISADAVNGLGAFVLKCIPVWDEYHQEILLPSTFKRLANFTALGVWKINCVIEVERNLTLGDWIDETQSVDDKKSSRAICQRLNRAMKRLHLEIRPESWKWTSPLVLRHRGCQVTTLTFENLSLGSLVAISERHRFLEKTLSAPPEWLRGDPWGLQAWTAAHRSGDGLVSWWWQEQEKARREGRVQWGGIECPVASTCGLCGGEGRRWEVCGSCGVAFFCCEGCGWDASFEEHDKAAFGECGELYDDGGEDEEE